LNLRHVN